MSPRKARSAGSAEVGAVCPPLRLLFYPRYPLTLSRGMEAIQDGGPKRMNRCRREAGGWWPPRFLDRALRTVKEDHETVPSIHLNPVQAGGVNLADDGAWSRVRD